MQIDFELSSVEDKASNPTCQQAHKQQIAFNVLARMSSVTKLQLKSLPLILYIYKTRLHDGWEDSKPPSNHKT